jgi:hypothetical protein
MKRSTPVLLLIVFAMTIFLTGSCSLGSPTATKKFSIVDRSSGRLLASYAMAPGARLPARIDSYDADQKLLRTYELEYDGGGRLSRSIVTTNVVSRPPLTAETSYTYSDVRDASGRLIHTDQYSSAGEKVETFYGYDETGQPRGVVERNGRSLVMKDFPQ